ncbi:hypothetical protein [Coleofasciculus sp. E1-EBD-02]|uniref:hypothetical protein n=1 Tax=Coleofasciculus sp. E1-EBD-02 TaxID=3068481 RepID=UPI0032F228E3
MRDSCRDVPWRLYVGAGLGTNIDCYPQLGYKTRPAQLVETPPVERLGTPMVRVGGVNALVLVDLILDSYVKLDKFQNPVQGTHPQVEARSE